LSLSRDLLIQLALTLTRRLSEAEVGHCMRVDHLAPEDAATVVADAVSHLTGDRSLLRLLVAERGSHEFGISVEEAVELRNRKQFRLCLVVPAGFSDAAVSSLGNSFAQFDVGGFFRDEATRILEELPGAERQAARRVRDMLHGPTEIAPEHWADYLARVKKEVGLEAMGLALWRVGLIPDAGEDFLSRLPENRACVMKVAQSRRPHTSASERLDDVGFVMGEVRTELLEFLGRQRLQDSRRWLKELADDPHKGRITFDRWELETH
jgi:hypothetical protein